MSYAIAMTTWKRPQYFFQVINALKANNLMGFTRLFINVEPGSTEIKKLVDGIDFIPKDVVYNPTVKGLPQNPFEVMTRAFQDPAVEFVLYVQDDCLLSSDALDVCRYYIEQIDHTNIFALCLFNAKTKDSANLSAVNIVSHNHFCSLGYGATKDQWNQNIKGHYFDNKAGYDWSLLDRQKSLNYSIVTPHISRCSHIGREDAVHYRPHIHDKEYMNHPRYNGTYPIEGYRYIGSLGVNNECK